MNSMTGYGGARVEGRDFSIEVEMQSYNHRFLDIKVKLPSEYLGAENYIVKKVSSLVSRGRINVFIAFRQKNGQYSVDINEPLAKKYWLSLDRLKRTLGIRAEMKPEILLDLPGVVRVSSGLPSAREFKKYLGAVLENALDKVIRMREKEGAHLRSALEKHLRALKRGLVGVRERAKKLRPSSSRPGGGIKGKKARPTVKIKGAKGVVSNVPAGENVEEEITRLESHISQFENFLDKDKPMGKILEFVCLEMLRETTTLGDKADDAFISKQVIFMKSEIESLREQIRNVE